MASEGKWHSSRPLTHLTPGDVLAVRVNQPFATPDDPLKLFEITEPATTLPPPAAKAEWEKSPFGGARFASDRGYFPHILDHLKPMSRSELMQHFVAPPSETLIDLIKLAREISEMSNCVRMHFGALILETGRIASIGFNHTYFGFQKDHCEPCLRQELGIKSGHELEVCRAMHAEGSAITFAQNHLKQIDFGLMVVAGMNPKGVPFDNPQFYCTLCSRTLSAIHGLQAIVTSTNEGPKIRPTNEVVDESFSFLTA